MTHETSRHIEAVIPSTEQPPRILVHVETGALPIIEHSREHGTYEGTLHELARRATGRALGVDKGLVSDKPDTNRYRTKPISPDTPIDAAYTWAAQRQ
jgi:hypothetical protein